jgi:hypothetical protein
MEIFYLNIHFLEDAEHKAGGRPGVVKGGFG